MLCSNFLGESVHMPMDTGTAECTTVNVLKYIKEDEELESMASAIGEQIRNEVVRDCTDIEVLQKHLLQLQ